jgi:hypothetical protein
LRMLEVEHPAAKVITWQAGRYDLFLSWNLFRALARCSLKKCSPLSNVGSWSCGFAYLLGVRQQWPHDDTPRASRNHHSPLSRGEVAAEAPAQAVAPWTRCAPAPPAASWPALAPCHAFFPRPTPIVYLVC